MGLIYSKKDDHKEMVDQLLKNIESKQIPDTKFAFRGLVYSNKCSEKNYIGKPIYPLSVFCQICGDRRFTDDEVLELTSDLLEENTFVTKYSNRKYEHTLVCHKAECENLVYVLRGGNNTHCLEASYTMFPFCDEFSFRNLKFSIGEFAGKPIYPLKVFCQICQERRFSQQEIDELSSSNLTENTFLEKYSHLKYVNRCICDKNECEMKTYLLIGGYNNYLLAGSFILYPTQ